MESGTRHSFSSWHIRPPAETNMNGGMKEYNGARVQFSSVPHVRTGVYARTPPLILGLGNHWHAAQQWAHRRTLIRTAALTNMNTIECITANLCAYGWPLRSKHNLVHRMAQYGMAWYLCACGWPLGSEWVLVQNREPCRL